MIPHTRRRRAGRRAGFTLLEILLVVGLLALLASFAIPALSGRGEKAKIDMVRAAIGPAGTITQCLDNYKFDIGEYPEELKYLVEKPRDDDHAKKWTSKYIPDIVMLKDPWGHDFMYDRSGKHNEGGVDLWSVGPDGRDGTDDDIVNWKTDR
jgi:general secretion pathway protein G